MFWQIFEFAQAIEKAGGDVVEFIRVLAEIELNAKIEVVSKIVHEKNIDFTEELLGELVQAKDIVHSQNPMYNYLKKIAKLKAEVQAKKEA